MTRRVRVWGPAWAMMGLIFGLSSMSQLPRVPGVFEDDGVTHAVAYGVLAALLLRGLAGARWHRVRVDVAWLAVLLATLYGVTDEVHQRFVPGRTAELSDLIADAVGGAAAAGLSLVWAWQLARRASRRAKTGTVSN
jgi:VanZ family protein